MSSGMVDDQVGMSLGYLVVFYSEKPVHELQGIEEGILQGITNIQRIASAVNGIEDASPASLVPGRWRTAACHDPSNSTSSESVCPWPCRFFGLMFILYAYSWLYDGYALIRGK